MSAPTMVRYVPGSDRINRGRPLFVLRHTLAGSDECRPPPPLANADWEGRAMRSLPVLVVPRRCCSPSEHCVVVIGTTAMSATLVCTASSDDAGVG